MKAGHQCGWQVYSPPPSTPPPSTPRSQAGCLPVPGTEHLVKFLHLPWPLRICSARYSSKQHNKVGKKNQKTKCRSLDSDNGCWIFRPLSKCKMRKCIHQSFFSLTLQGLVLAVNASARIYRNEVAVRVRNVCMCACMCVRILSRGMQ